MLFHAQVPGPTVPALYCLIDAVDTEGSRWVDQMVSKRQKKVSQRHQRKAHSKSMYWMAGLATMTSDGVQPRQKPCAQAGLGH